MKKILIAFFAMSSFAANAQIEKGRVVASASVAIQSSENNNTSIGSSPATQTTKINNSAFGLSFGTFVSNNLQLLITVGYTTTKTTEENLTYKSITKDEFVPLGIGTKYYHKLGGKFYYNINFDATYAPLKYSNTASYVGADGSTSSRTNKGDGKSISAKISPLQITYALSRHFLIEAGFASINYTNNKLNLTQTSNPPRNPNPENELKNKQWNINLSPVNTSLTFSYVF